MRTEHWFEYVTDSVQRSVLFMDILRKRGNNYLDHLQGGQPPVLAFEHERVLDGSTFERPVNYDLVRILDRRDVSHPDRRTPAGKPPTGARNRRSGIEQRYRTEIAQKAPEAVKRPVIIFDPRAGHGPGIGGSKEESQIGMALDAGHPVYYLVFSTMPVRGQTLADVRNAQIRFVEAVRNRHPDASPPAVIGNCQGGWAAALVGAEKPDLVGPMVFNGSPLSYWGGVVGVNPMRYFGGLLGGTWFSSLMSDLGNGCFDGAHLVANFENLNPANTLWTKQYHVYANVDTEEKRFLDFEKWWGGFFLLDAREIHQIVEGLFIGNKLERGEFEIEPDQHVDLKRNRNPIVLFASFGDNITPPQQAFNWIVKTYGTDEEIKRRGQVIVCIHHSKIGHLGIFVSAKIARKEHKEIIASFDMLGYLPPGLYEMHIEEAKGQSGEYEVHYSEKTMADILSDDDGLTDESAFLTVRCVSEALDFLYRLTLSPCIRWFNNDITAHMLRQSHPLRMQRYLISDLNPCMLPVKALASSIRNGYRQPAEATNPFLLIEKETSGLIASGLNLWGYLRDTASELLFKTMYENPVVNTLSHLACIPENGPLPSDTPAADT
jgi:poly(3-hydroxyalkanoate) synthetase